VVWVPWRRPGWQLGRDIAEIKEANPNAIGVILGGHGTTAWGETSEECEKNSLEIIRRAEEFIDDAVAALRAEGRHPFGSIRAGYGPLDAAERRSKAALLAPVIR